MLLLLAAIGILLTSPPSEKLADGSPVKQELVFWGMFDLPELYQPIIDAFETTHPDIRVVYKQFSDREEYQQVLLSQFDQKRGPDVFVFDQDTMALVESHLAPTSLQDIDEFPPFVQQTLVKSQSLMALPLWVDSLMIYYHKRYYRDGIAPLWHDFAEQTKSISIGGIAMGRLDNLRSGWDIVKALLLQKQVKLVGKPENSLYDTLEFFIRFAIPTDRYFNWNENLSKNYPDQEVDSFIRQKVAAIAGFASHHDFFAVKLEQLSAKKIAHIKAEDIGVSLFPQFTTDQPRYFSKYMALGVSKASKKPELAWEFIRLLTNRTNADYYAQASGRTAGRFLPIADNASEVAKVQRLQLSNAEVYTISSEVQEKLASVIEKALKKKSALREVLELKL